jgi:hypothetical protein
MSIYAVNNTLTQTTRAKKMVDETAVEDVSFASESTLVADTPVAAETHSTAASVNTQVFVSQNPTSIDSTGSLTQNVLDTMKNMGLNTTSISMEGHQVLQNFVQSLYKALTPVGVVNSDTPINAVKKETNLLISGGDGLKYTIDLEDANLGDYLPDVIHSLKTALDNIGRYIRSDVVFNIKVIGQNTSAGILAQTEATMTEATTQSQQKLIDTSFVSDVTYQSELHPNTPDANLFINLERIGEMSFTPMPTPDKFDFTSIITHEILHGLAFSGALGNTNTPLRSKYDELVMMQNNTPYFVGVNAQKANGGNPVLLVPESAGSGSAFYHVNVAGDLMAETIQKGQVSVISPLDIAILQDIGIPIAHNDGLPPKAQIAYGSPDNGLQKLIGTVQEASILNEHFDHLMLTFTDKNSVNAPIKLHDFLSQLSLNTLNNNILQNTVGSFMSVAA